jgi:transcription antitermination factor NusG
MQPTTSAVLKQELQPEQKHEGEQERRNRERIDRVEKLLNDCLGWYVVMVPPQKEIIVERLLRICNFSAFVPVEFRWRRVNSKQKVKRFVPYILASRYVFIGIDNSDPFSWARLFKLDLGLKPLMHDGRPVMVPQQTMRDLFAVSNEAADRVSAIRLNKSLVVGDCAMITAGPFQGHVVRIDGIEKGRAKSMVNLFQTAQEVELDMGILEAV